jgi:tetratricopeptide (TPR) repeat protein
MSASQPLPEHGLLQQANRLIWDGDWRGAARLLLQAASLAECDGRAADAARARQMAASLSRYAGDTEGALASAQALAATPADPARMAFAAAAERGETHLADGDYDAAIDAYRAAFEQADRLALPPAWRATVLRRLGEAQVRAGQSDDGLATFAQASTLHRDEGDVLGAASIDVEGAEALAAAGDWPQALAASDRAQHAVQALDAPALAARVALLRARRARADGDGACALAAAEQARTLALTAVAPLSYFAAAALLAELHDAQHDRVAAYRVLAAAWATLSDLLGRDIGASWIKPLLLAFNLRWGDAEFARVKGEHDAQRRAERNGSQPV